MSFVSLILKNLLRQKVRAGLTLVGITMGITTVVALGAITAGFKQTTGSLLTMRRADFIVAQEGASDLSFSTIQASEVANVRTVPGVAAAQGILFHITKAGSNLFFFVIGVSAEDLAADPPALVAGRLFEPASTDQILLGQAAAKDLNANPGTQVTIDKRTFTVAGVYRSDGIVENGGAYVPIAAAEQLTSKPGVVSVIQVTVAPGADIRAVAAAIEATRPNLATITNVDEIGKVDQGVKILDAANLAISVLAVAIGAIGVMNTMIMSVFERTREIGIFRAVGWSGARVLSMILAESIALCLIAAVIGTALGTAIAQAVTLIPSVESLLRPSFGTDIFVRAVAVAVVVAVVGAAYPAYRAVRLTPLAALRYE